MVTQNVQPNFCKGTVLKDKLHALQCSVYGGQVCSDTGVPGLLLKKLVKGATSFKGGGGKYPSPPKGNSDVGML